jgi:predicted outer membrane repeat protein
MGLDPNNRRPSTLAVSYCDIGGWKGPKDVNVIDPNVVFAEPGCNLVWDFGTVIDADPRFVNAYFLSHTAAGQMINSKCIDAGSDLASNLNLSTFTTRIDGVVDMGIVDIGYHYPAAAYQLRVDVVGGNGSVDPNRGTFNRNAVVTLRAKPNPGYRVQGWYDVNNVLLSVDRTMEVLMDSDLALLVRFERARTVDVSGGGNAIQVAIDQAKSGDVLVVAAGTYNGNISLRGKDVTVVCTNPDDPNIIGSTIIDCQQSGRGFIFNNAEDANTVVNGFTIVNGSVTGQGGGGIYIDPNSGPTIVNVTINNCSAAQANGGGIYVDANSSPIFINCTITNCSADAGGGAFCDFNSAPTFSYCLFGDNSADSGAGLYYDANCVSKVLECRFTSNSAAQDGGGLYCDPNSIITIADCNFADNSAIRGGGLYCDPNCWVTVAKTIFSDNTASADGGAVYLYHANVSISDSTIVSNSAIRGGGLWCYDSPATTITGCTIRYNRAGPLFDPNDPNDPNALVIGAGGGVYCFATAGLFRDCVITHNIANTSGGGIYVGGDVNSPAIKNSLIVYNFAGRDGGGVSVNWHARPTISTCTFVGNAAPGTYGDVKKTGIGGGLYCSYHALANVTDSIFWKNFALRGHELAVGTGFEYDPRYGTLSVSYCDVEAGQGEVEVDTGCTLNWGPGNISTDPFFVTGRLDSFYLSQVAAGQSRQSPCVNAGSSYMSDLGLVGYTTRTDEMADTLTVDMGYHHPTAQPCRFCDLVYDGIINFRDFAILAEKWLAKGCSDTNTWCQGRDFTFDTLLNMEDIAFLADCWLVRDVEPPIPDPSLWDVEPYMSSASSVTMAAELAFDAWGWNVQYYFQCYRGNCHGSGWRDSPTYTDSGLTAGTRYAYRVKARDEIGNETEWSIIRYAGEEDRTPPAPAPEWEREPYALSDDAIAMIATPVFDDSGVEYYFQSVSGGGHDSGWQDQRGYTDTNLDPNTEYCYRVKARDKSFNRNETPWSTVACVTTFLPPDTTPPTPNPMQFDPNGAPQEIYGGGGTWDYYAQMTAVVAADASGFVQYYFECIDVPGLSSGWQAANTYTVLVGGTGRGWHFRVRARDLYGNVTAWSPALPALPP